MLYIPPTGLIQVEHNTGAVGALTIGTAVTTGAAANTKGAVAELIASTAFDSYRMLVLATAYGIATVSSSGSMDILIGAATEEVLIPDLLMGGCAGDTSGFPGIGKWWDFPLYVPAGSRLSCQAAGERLSTAFRVAVYLYGGTGYPPFGWCGTKVTTYGMGTVPYGTVIVPGQTGVEGAWTEVTASTDMVHHALVPSFQLADTVSATRFYTLDIGVGAATEEQVSEGYWWTMDTNEKFTGPMPTTPCFLDLPAGSRIAMRVSNSGVNESSYTGVIHAVS